MPLPSSAAAAAALTLICGTAVLAVPAGASMPVPFPVYDSGSVLVTAHPVAPGERLVIRGRPVTLGAVSHPGPAFVAHVLGVLPAAWKGRTLAAVAEG